MHALSITQDLKAFSENVSHFSLYISRILFTMTLSILWSLFVWPYASSGETTLLLFLVELHCPSWYHTDVQVIIRARPESGVSTYKAAVFPTRIPLIKIVPSHDDLIFLMGMSVHRKTVLILRLGQSQPPLTRVQVGFASNRETVLETKQFQKQEEKIYFWSFFCKFSQQITNAL